MLNLLIGFNHISHAIILIIKIEHKMIHVCERIYNIIYNLYQNLEWK